MKFEESMLSAYLDGELNDEERRVVELQLRKDPGAKELLDGLRSLRSVLLSLPAEAFSEDPVVGVRKKIAIGAKGDTGGVAGDVVVAARGSDAVHGARGNGVPRWLLPFTVAVAAALLGVVFYLPRFSFEVADRVGSNSGGDGLFDKASGPEPGTQLADSPAPSPSVMADIPEAAPGRAAIPQDSVEGSKIGTPSDDPLPDSEMRSKRAFPSGGGVASRGGVGGASVAADSIAMVEPAAPPSDAMDRSLAGESVAGDGRVVAMDRAVAMAAPVPSVADENGVFLEAPWGTRVGLDEVLIVPLPNDTAEPRRARELNEGAGASGAQRFRNSVSEWVRVSVSDPRRIAAQCLVEQGRASGIAESKGDAGGQGVELRAGEASLLSQVVERLVGGGVVAIEFRGTAGEFAGVLERLARVAGEEAIESRGIVPEPSVEDADSEALSRDAEGATSVLRGQYWLLIELSGKGEPAPR